MLPRALVAAFVKTDKDFQAVGKYVSSIIVQLSVFNNTECTFHIII